MDEREKLIQELIQARGKLLGVLNQFDPSLKVYPEWTIKELLAHLAGWDDAIIEMFALIANNQPPSTPAALGIDYYNARTVTEREALNIDHTRKECERTRQVVIEQLRQFPLERLHEQFITPWGARLTIAQLIRVFIHHESEEHAHDMQQLYEQLHK